MRASQFLPHTVTFLCYNYNRPSQAGYSTWLGWSPCQKLNCNEVLHRSKVVHRSEAVDQSVHGSSSLDNCSTVSLKVTKSVPYSLYHTAPSPQKSPSLYALGLFPGHVLANAVPPACAGQFLFPEPEITDSCSPIASWLWLFHGRAL